MDICYWFKDLSSKESGLSEAKAYNEKLRRELDAMANTCPPFEGDPADCALNKKPETIESVLNKFIDAGYDKPKVVIKGETRLDGSENWTATVDDIIACEIRPTRIGFIRIDDSNSLKGIEKIVKFVLKQKLSQLVKTETTITY